MTIASAIVPIAIAEIGVHEDGHTNTGKRVNEYKAATWLPPEESWAWCAAFVDWCVMKAIDVAGIKNTITFTRPRTAGAWDLERWSLAQDSSTWTLKPVHQDIEPGDIIIYRFHHCGIAVSVPSPHQIVQVVEGNTNTSGSRDGGEVARQSRHITDIKCRIRFRV